MAYNFRRARELRGWTQEETASRLEAFTGTRLPQASISTIERAYDSDKHREFDAQEILVFARAFNLPLLWFFIPPPGDRRNLAQTSDHLDDLFLLTIGYAEQTEALHDRLREIGLPQPEEDDAAIERLTGAPTDVSRDSYQRRRKEMILAMLDQRADKLDKAADELGRFFDHLRQVGIRGFVAETTDDRDFGHPPGRTAPRGRARR